jgi:hypothetical protein
MPHIFHIYLFFIFFRELNSAIFRLLLNRFYIIQNSKQAPPTVVQTSFDIVFVYDDELLLFKQTYLRRRSTFWGNNSRIRHLSDWVYLLIPQLLPIAVSAPAKKVGLGRELRD